MTKAIAHTYTIAHEYRKQITTALLATCVVFALLYAMNLYRIISHTVALQQVATQARMVETATQELDAQYLSISNTISPGNIGSYGFMQGEVQAFISRSNSSERVALAGHE